MFIISLYIVSKMNSASDIVLVLFLRYHKNVSSESTLQLIDYVVLMPQLEGNKGIFVINVFNVTNVLSHEVYR